MMVYAGIILTDTLGEIQVDLTVCIWIGNVLIIGLKQVLPMTLVLMMMDGANAGRSTQETMLFVTKVMMSAGTLLGTFMGLVVK
jgi:hypothetical protein